ncbi:MAG: chemotaxis protein CheX [Campylobacterota bacterium]|nr:chemotaxis protein CheX [Campylobacterota bacterium]
MVDVIVESAQNFVKHQMELESVKDSEISSEDMFISYIDITMHDGLKQRIYLGCHRDVLQRLADIMLFEEESEDEVLQDMMLETANLVIGSAKVLASESYDIHFDISTPYFEKIAPFDFEYDKIQSVIIDGNAMIVANKTLQ